jgi:putative flavoprotein involved in K+ transport
MRLPGRRGRYPTQDDDSHYLRDYATHFRLPVCTGARVLDTSWDGEAFEITLADGKRLTARSVIAASAVSADQSYPRLPLGEVDGDLDRGVSCVMLRQSSERAPLIVADP